MHVWKVYVMLVIRTIQKNSNKVIKIPDSVYSALFIIWVLMYAEGMSLKLDCKLNPRLKRLKKKV